MNRKSAVHILIVGFLLLAACSPYTSQIKKLDQAYAAGQVNAATYFAERQQLMQGDMEWRQTVAANAAAMNQGVQQNSYQQAQLAAYNARTWALWRPTPIPPMPNSANAIPLPTQYNGTITAPNGQMTTYRGTSY